MSIQKGNTKRTIVILAAVLIMAAVASGFFFLSASQYFSLDINPSVEIETNRLDNVVSINALNADAQTLVAGYRGSGKNLGEVIEDLVDRMILQGYLGDEKENDILITVKDDSVSQKTLDKVNESIEKHLDNRNIKANLHQQKTNWNEETEKSAEIAGVSPGKMIMAEEMAEDTEISPQELSSLAIGELVSYKDSDKSIEEDDEQDEDNWDFVDEDNEDNVDTDLDKSADTTESTTTANAPVDEVGAKAIFESHYPGVGVQKIKLQDGGKVYYMHSSVDGMNYKMKVRVSDGEVLYNHSGGNGGNTENSNVESIPVETSTPETPVTSTGGTVDEAGAKAIFESYYPGVGVQKIQLQDGGKVYYMYSNVGGVNYKMKVRVSDGEVVYNYSGNNGGNGGYSNSSNVESSQEASATESPAISTGGAVDEAGAKAIFESHYPGVGIQKIQLQDGGKVYYMYSESDGNNYKMKVRVSDGEVVYNYSGSTGGNGNNNGGGNNKGGRGSNYGGR